jgi:hypothetical protein
MQACGTSLRFLPRLFRGLEFLAVRREFGDERGVLGAGQAGVENVEQSSCWALKKARGSSQSPGKSRDR